MFVLLFLNIISVFVCFYIARTRKAESYYWAFMGTILGPLAIPFVFFSKPIEKSQKPT